MQSHIRLYVVSFLLLLCAYATSYSNASAAPGLSVPDPMDTTILQFTYPPVFTIMRDNAPVVVSPAYGEEDYTYRDLCLMGDEIRGGRFPECIPHKRTNNFSPLYLSPWYLTNIQSVDPDMPGPHVGPGYRGDRNNFRLIQPTEETTVDVCKQIVEPNSDLDPYNPITARKEMDNCTDQYILFRSNFPRIPVATQGELPDIEQERQDFCQPLRMVPFPIEEQEYVPSEYYVEAWKKTMMDTQHLARGGLAPKEPLYSALGLSLKETIDIRPDFSIVEINDLTEFPYERIYDPTHPYTPRWDFLYNERAQFSPMTTPYGGNPTDAVRCAKDVPTDVMTWRKPGFELYITWRIAFNIACYEYPYCWAYFMGTSEDPPCPTKYNGPEKVEIITNKQTRQVLCGPPHIVELCDHITKPVAPANALKLRDINEENFPFGVAQGYSFKQYFGENKPYMRCWDTGLECGRTEPPIIMYGIPDLYQAEELDGANYAVVGAGREGESCLIGGGNGTTVSQVDGMADPVMDWMELKLYQLRGRRETGLDCLVKHERVWKLGNGEEIITGRSGGQWQKLLPSVEGELIQYDTMPFPLSWRGYVGEPEPEMRFPSLGAPGPLALPAGLDYAWPGEVLVYDQDVTMVGPPGTWRLPYIGFTTEVNNVRAEGKGLHWVKMLSYNHGKFPDSCGNTEYLGLGEEFTVYKTDLPTHNKETLDALGHHTKECEDPMLSACIEPLWGAVKRYVPIQDIRR